MDSIPRSRRALEPGSGGKIVRTRRLARTRTPYDRPALTANPPPPPPESPNWLARFLYTPTRSIVSGAGKVLSSVFRSDSSSSSSSEIGSDDEEGDDDYVSSQEDDGLNQRNGTSEPLFRQGESKHAIEQLLRQETFSREECDKLIKIIKSRVVGCTSTEDAQNTRLNMDATDLSATAISEAKKWVMEKRLGSASKSELGHGTILFPQGAEDDGGSPVDVAKSYMRALPPWASPSSQHGELRSTSPLGLQLFNEETPYSLGGTSVTSKLKRDAPATGSWNIQEEIRRVRTKATEEMLRSLPSTKIDWSAFSRENRSTLNSLQDGKQEADLGDKLKNPILTQKPISMAPPIMLLLLLASFLIPTQTQFQVEAKDEAFTSIVISQKGLDFLKELLVTEAVSSIIPLQIPRIEKSVRFPFLGSVEMVVSNITIYGIDVGSSYVKLGDDGIAIIASKTTCNLSMNWYYSYTTWVAPIEVEDEGSASVQVEGVEVGLTLGLGIQEGTLKLSLKDCGCYVKEISIKLDGGASWFYQGMINAFEEQIGSAVENAITKKLKDGIVKLDTLLQALPKEIPLDDDTYLNATFVNDPVLSNSSIGFEINGLFTARRKPSVSEYLNKDTKALVACSDPSKMLGIALDEAVFNSVAATYFDAEFMQWIVDKIPDQSFLNTAGYRFIIPQLYKKYPNHDMNLNISLSSPPIIEISEHDIGAIIYADLIIDVLDEDGVIPVACISLVIRGSSSVKISGNNLAGNMKVDDFSMSLKWSNIGNLRMYLIQPVVWTGIQTVFVPYVNKHLGKGIPLPIVHGFTIQNGELLCSDSRIMVCSDVTYEPSDSHNLNWLLPSLSKYTHAT